jgi:hypothetical protein
MVMRSHVKSGTQTVRPTYSSGKKKTDRGNANQKAIGIVTYTKQNGI